jgi:O-antigen ligase
MKSKTAVHDQNSIFRTLEILYLALPILALAPNFFIIPELNYPGLATSELVFGISVMILSLVAAILPWREPSQALKLDRDVPLIIAAFVLFLLWQLISLAWAPAKYDGLRLTGIWFGFGVLLFIGWSAIRERSAVWLHNIMTGVAIILAISIYYERSLHGDNMLGIFFSHGITAELLVTMLPLQILTYLCSQKRNAVIVGFLTSGMSLVALLMGLRRGALLATLAILIAIGICLALKAFPLPDKKRLLVLVAMAIIATGVLGTKYREAVVYRIKGATQLNAAEGGLRTRMRGWITAWEMGKRNVLAGVGNGGYPNLYGTYRRHFASNPKYADLARSAGAEDYDEIRNPLAHNEYLQTFVELGLIGLFLFIAFWGLIVKKLWRGWRDYRVAGVLLGLLAFGISSAVSAFSLRFSPEAFLLPCLLSIGVACLPRPEGEKEEVVSETISIKRPIVLVAVMISLLGSLLFTARTYNVYASQRLQGRIDATVPPLDFAFFPENPAGNEALERRYKEVLRLDSENAGAQLGYGLLLFRMKKPTEAIPHLEFARTHGYSRPFGYILLAFAHEQANDSTGAARIMEDCVAAFPQSMVSRAVFGELLRKSGQAEAASKNQQEMYAMNKVEAQSWENALRLKTEEAIAEATRRGLIRPDALQPRFVSALVGVRSMHYLR